MRKHIIFVNEKKYDLHFVGEKILEVGTSAGQSICRANQISNTCLLIFEYLCNGQVSSVLQF